MNKTKLQKTLTESLNRIDGAMAGLDAYPSLEDAVLDKASSEANKYLGKIFPTQLDFSIQILEHLVGTDVLIDIISDFLTVALPGVEVAIKSALLANMNSLGSGCTIDPFIYEKAIKEGVTFDLRQIDLIDKLKISPLDKKLGKYYYFGVDDCESAYDVLQSAISPNNGTSNQEKTSYLSSAESNSVGHYFGEKKRDFDCLLWYMKNKAAYREVWGKRTTESESIFNGDSDAIEWLKKKGSKKSKYYKVDENGNITTYEYSSGNWIEHKKSGSIVAVDTKQTYTYLSGTTYYTYSYGNPSIKKVSRKKYYFDGTNINYFSNEEWNKATYTKNEYTTINDVPTTVKTNDTFWLNNELYIVKDVKISGGKITKLEKEKCVDVRNDVKHGTCMFVDYSSSSELTNKTNKEAIEAGNIEKVTVAFGNGYNDVIKTWNSEKETSKKVKEVTVGSLYYIKDGDFDVQTSKILITPYYKETKDNKEKAYEYVNLNEEMENKCKYTKDFGVVTLDFSPRTGNVRQSDGDPMHQQTPYDNVLHVFFGNVKELSDSNRTSLENNLKSYAELNKLGAQLVSIMETIMSTYKKQWNEEKKQWSENNKALRENKKNTVDYSNEDDGYEIVYKTFEIVLKGNSSGIKTNLTSKSPCFNGQSELNSKLIEISRVINKYFTHNEETNEWTSNDSMNNFWSSQNFRNDIYSALKSGEDTYSISAYAKRANKLVETNENLLYLSAKNVKYPEAKKNYYLKRTLFEFNTDYINSLQLFDSKVLAAQLITSLFGGLALSTAIGMSTNWKTELIHDTVKNIVEKIIASQDYVVSDCFFTFTNDAYNGMLRATELRQAGLYSKHGEENGNSTIDPLTLLEGLNSLDTAADLSEQSSIIKGTITNASAEVSKDSYISSGTFGVNSHFGVQTSFIETLITNLCTQLVMSVLSPKVYLLILMNLQMFGISTNFDLRSFIQKFNGLISSIIKSIVEKFMEFLNTKILELVEELASKLKTKIGFEQAEMYMRLLKRIYEHLRSLLSLIGNGATSGWVQDIVGNADILETDKQEVTNEC